MKYKMQFRTDKFEGLYPVYEPFFKEVQALGGTISDTFIEFPDSIDIDTVAKLVKPYHDYIRLTPLE